MQERKLQSGFGRMPKVLANVHSFDTAQIQAMTDAFIPCGELKSYGDSALYHHILKCDEFKFFAGFDATTGLLHVGSGVTIAEIIKEFLPKGFFVPVVPGTKMISIGGACAFDIHGKNHHIAGCFSEAVAYLDVFIPEFGLIRCSRTQERELFLATMGGMGLTGVIIQVGLYLEPVPSHLIAEKRRRCGDLLELMECFESNKEDKFTVAWLDSTATRKNLGRGIFIAGSFASNEKQKKLRFTKPVIKIESEISLISNLSCHIFNTMYFHKEKRNWQRIVGYDSFFFPLDQISGWNKLYGAKGFCQYQFVIEKKDALKNIQTFLKEAQKKGAASFLTVLKLFGKENENYLSFPKEGYTVAIDFAMNAQLFSNFIHFDNLIEAMGGRVYLAKDCRLGQEKFRKFYPKWEKFIEIRNKYNLQEKICSLQAKRLGL